MAAEDGLHPFPTAVIHRMPEPPLFFLLAHEAPHFVDLRLVHLRDYDFDLLGAQRLEKRSVDRLKCVLFFFNSLITVEGLTPNTRAVSRTPLPFTAMPFTELAQILLQLATHVKFSKFRKHRRGPKKPRPNRDKHPDQPHVSTAKLLTGKYP
jgi:hypothetical protein